MKSTKFIIVIILLLSAILLSYSLPRAKYSGTGFVSKLQIPESISEWTGVDVTEQAGLDIDKPIYGFVSEALAYNYTNKKGENLLFIILDAGNFHHPKVCFTEAGYKIEELSDTEFNIAGHTLKTHTLFTERGGNSFLSFYWIVIDKNIAHEWVEQKLKQFYFSMFNKKRVGLMVRIDVPTKKENIKESLSLARQFIREMGQSIPSESVEYIFGNF